MMRKKKLLQKTLKRRKRADLSTGEQPWPRVLVLSYKERETHTQKSETLTYILTTIRSRVVPAGSGMTKQKKRKITHMLTY